MRSLLITGGTGTLGRHLIQRVLEQKLYDRVVCYSRDEFKQAMMHGLPWGGADDRLRFFLGDVRDRERLSRAMIGVTDVVHAAALKWIGDGIYNPDELVKTNVGGTMHVIEAAAERGVQRVVVTCSDKGCHPANVYGATKFLAEQYAVQANAYTFPRGTRVACVRYGNVLWSRGSVAHRFVACLHGGETFRVTDRRMTRFGIRLSAAVDFVLAALARLRGGEIFVPALPSFRIVDVAAAVWNRWITKKVEPPIEVVGHRLGGEKLHEVLLTPEEAPQTRWIEDAWGACWVVEPQMRSWDRPAWEGTPVPEGFRYASDTNSVWLDPLALRETLTELDPGLATC